MNNNLSDSINSNENKGNNNQTKIMSSQSEINESKTYSYCKDLWVR